MEHLYPTIIFSTFEYNFIYLYKVSSIIPGARLGVGLVIGVGAINAPRQNISAHACLNSPIQIHPSPQFFSTRFALATPPPPTTGRRGGYQGCVPRQVLWHTKQAIFRGAQIIWSIITSIQSKIRDSDMKRKRETHIQLIIQQRVFIFIVHIQCYHICICLFIFLNMQINHVQPTLNIILFANEISDIYPRSHV